MVETTRLQTLYEQDMVAWCDDTVDKLKASNFGEIDLDHLTVLCKTVLSSIK